MQYNVIRYFTELGHAGQSFEETVLHAIQEVVTKNINTPSYLMNSPVPTKIFIYLYSI